MHLQKIITYAYVELTELSLEEQHLLHEALLATDTSYAPYSKFHVGCAIELQNGEIYKGNNQENRAYPSGMCAERTALYFIGALGKGKDIRKMAIRARCANVPVTHPITPCGSCRQVMVEYEEMTQKDITVLMMGESGKVLKVEGIKKSLFPFSFDAEF